MKQKEYKLFIPSRNRHISTVPDFNDEKINKSIDKRINEICNNIRKHFKKHTKQLERINYDER